MHFLRRINPDSVIVDDFGIETMKTDSTVTDYQAFLVAYDFERQIR